METRKPMSKNKTHKAAQEAKKQEAPQASITKPTKYQLEDFLPLIIIFASIITFTLVRQWYTGWNFHTAMYDFMGSFFIVFGAFKVINLAGFTQAYAMYDIIAKKYSWYGYIYPFLEIGLGISYLAHFAPWWINLFTFVLMSVSSIGVAQELLANREIVCACLGAVFKIPMTWVTFIEDVLMAGMALWMLFW